MQRIQPAVLLGLTLAITGAAASAQCNPPLFSALPTVAPNQNNPSLVLADFNHDGRLDLASPGLGQGQVVVALSTGNGTFSAPVSYPAPMTSLFLRSGDFDGDGNLDLVDAAYEGLEVYFGNGDGTFSPLFVPVPGEIQFRTLAVGDVNNDGLSDILVTSDAATLLYLGQASRSFPVPTPIAPGDPSLQPDAVGDVNGDGNLDLVVINGFTPSVMLGDGLGGFGPLTPVSPDFAKFAWLADVNGDGELDLLAAGALPRFSVSIGHGDGTFGPPQYYDALGVGGGNVALAAGDLNGDGRPDVVVFSQSDFSATVLLNSGQGAFGAPYSVAPDGPYYEAAIGDVNGDGGPDLVFARYFGGMQADLNSCVPPAAPTLSSGGLACLILALGAVGLLRVVRTH